MVLKFSATLLILRESQTRMLKGVKSKMLNFNSSLAIQGVINLNILLKFSTWDLNMSSVYFFN